jgi:hypothetical protein
MHEAEGIGTPAFAADVAGAGGGALWSVFPSSDCGEGLKAECGQIRVLRDLVNGRGCHVNRQSIARRDRAARGTHQAWQIRRLCDTGCARERWLGARCSP